MAAKVPSKVKEIQEYRLEHESGSKSISFSQLSLYAICPNRWYRAYVLKEAPFEPSIHLTFGTSVHETMQHWLEIMYNETIKASDEFDMNSYLLDRMKVNYGAAKVDSGLDFSSKEQLQEFYEDGVAILDYVKKARKAYFDPKNEWLVGCEIPIYFKLREKFYFKGFIDVLVYNEKTDRWKIFDIKTSTSGWGVETKKDFIKTSQVLLYREFLSKQFGIDPEKIDIEYFIVKRKINEEAEFPSMKRRVQEFVPSHGPRVSKRAVQLVESFLTGAVAEDGSYLDREYETVPCEKSCKWCPFKDTCKSATTLLVQP